ncbi:MAG: lytic transglycosylase domain-containing protein [Halothermotrichaceae bacterium]
MKYEEIIIEKARKYNLDPDLVAAMIFVESKYIEDAKSHRGAVGLMQIMPDTGQWIAEKILCNDYNIQELYKPAVNIEFGCWYLSNLNQQFDNELIIVLAAYNAGRGNVSKWLKHSWNGQHTSLSDLPFKETRDYIKQILTVYEHYQRIYNLNNNST